MLTRRPAIFLAREGVLTEPSLVNEAPRSQQDAAPVRLLPGVEEACRVFREARLLMVVVTNQPDVSRGHLYPSQLTAVHRALAEALPLDDIMVCIHDDDAGCPCRKPRPGMILDAARRLGIDLDRSVYVGGHWDDLESARRAGVSSVYIDWSCDEVLPHHPDGTFASLLDSCGWVMGATGHRDFMGVDRRSRSVS